ncbi:MAG: hypothetical protein ACOVMP_10220, partial [Chthoniobacterales bacterium]
LQDGSLRELKVFSAIQKRKAAGRPGEILDTGDDGVLIAAGSGAVLLREIQMEGRKRMQAGIWQRGTPIARGEVAGQQIDTPSGKA